MKSFIDNHYKIIFFTILSALSIYVFHNVLSVLFFAFSIAVVVEPIYIDIQMRMQRKNYRTGLWSDIILFLFLLGITICAVFIVGIPIYYFTQNFHQLVSLVSAAFEFVGSSSVSTYVPIEDIQSITMGYLSGIASFFAGHITRLPEHFSTLLVFYISLYVFIKYFGVITRDLLAVTPHTWRKVLKVMYLKTYILFNSFYFVHMLIAIIVFCLALVFFFVIGVSDHFFMALLTAMFQLIPFVGAAFMMICYSVYFFVTKDISHLFLILLIGFPLLVIVPEMVIRPWLMGKRSRISMPVLLIGILAGIKSLGMIGIIAGPLILILCQEMFHLLKERYGKQVS